MLAVVRNVKRNNMYALVCRSLEYNPHHAKSFSNIAYQMNTRHPDLHYFVIPREDLIFFGYDPNTGQRVSHVQD